MTGDDGAAASAELLRAWARILLAEARRGQEIKRTPPWADEQEGEP